jgi:hypothetical protein
MTDKDELIQPAPRQGAATLRDRIQPLCELTARHAPSRLSAGERIRLRRVESAEAPEAQQQRREALRRLRHVALEVAQGAADRVLLIDAELATTSEHLRATAQDLSRDPSRPLHERMLLVGLWSEAATPPRPATRRHTLRRRQEAARVRKARKG